MSAVPNDVLWPMARVSEALAGLGHRAGYHPRAAPLEVGTDQPRATAVNEYVDAAARRLGLDTEAVEMSYPEVASLIRKAAPALLHVPDTNPPCFIALTAGGRRRLLVLSPNLTVRRVDAESVRTLLCQPVEMPLEGTVAQLLTDSGVEGVQRPKSRELLLEHLLATRSIGGCWLVRAGDAAGPFVRMGGASFLRRLAILVVTQLFQYALYTLSWWLIAWMVLSDRFDGGLLAAWTLLYVTVTPLRLYVYVAAGNLSVDVGAELKRLFLAAAFKLDPNEIRHMGAGHLLGRTLEIDAIEAFSFTGALYFLIGASELAFVTILLAAGAGGWFHVAVLGAWIVVAILLSAAYYRERLRWTRSRFGITNVLVEQIVGHRTRLAQDPNDTGALRDDDALRHYHLGSTRLNRYEVCLQALLPRGWFIVGIAAAVPAFVSGGATASGLAAALGGVLIGFHAFQMLAGSLEQLVGALVAWRQLAPVLANVHRFEPAGLPTVAPALAGQSPAGLRRSRTTAPMLDVRGLVFRHPERSEPVLRNTTLQVSPRDRILIEGASGEGKSTLASILSACRTPQAGVILLRGLDPPTVGHRRWRQRVVHVPQFHENHVLTATFAFNLLMGRGWPPRQEDLRQAELVCRSLGLGPLLDRMPGRLFEMVGDTGWQLSHGERTRLFTARAILQRPDVMILDESLAALDPDTLMRTLDYLFESDGALVVIAHP